MWCSDLPYCLYPMLFTPSVRSAGEFGNILSDKTGICLITTVDRAGQVLTKRLTTTEGNHISNRSVDHVSYNVYHAGKVLYHVGFLLFVCLFKKKLGGIKCFFSRGYEAIAWSYIGWITPRGAPLEEIGQSLNLRSASPGMYTKNFCWTQSHNLAWMITNL